MIGAKLLHYEITEKLGEGGMGVVYKARDTHLDRFVAIKVLPPERMADASRKARFVQEAKAASALNHPNIITVHDISSDAGTDFIAMEYVAGKTLDQLIPRKGMRLIEALKIAVQIADALTRAHAAGIIHRDLKPANIMVDAHGQVKVLDFGLAKLTEQGATSEDAATETIGVKTDEGAIVGTAAYMSPEQAEGKPLDARSDIFSFGAVLYEMVTGQRAFRGDSKLSTLSAVLHKEPAPLAADLPRDLIKIIARCLKKDPDWRFQNMADLKVAIAEVKVESDSGGLSAESPQLPRRRRWLWAAGLSALFVAAAVGYWLLYSPRESAAKPLKPLPLTTYPGQEWSPSFSPDGNQVAFSWNGEKQDNFDIHVLVVGTGARLRLTQDPATDYSPAWSPDGRYIAFLRQLPQGKSAVFLIPPIGGAARKLAEVAASTARFPNTYPRLAWSPDSHWVAGSDGAALVLVSTETGEKRSLTSPPPQNPDQDPAFSSDGRTLAFIRSTGTRSMDLCALRLSPDLKPTGEPRRLAGDWRMALAPHWTPRGDEVVFSWGLAENFGLWRISALGAGAPQPIALPGAGLFTPALSRQGARLVYAQWDFDSDIWRIELDRPMGKATRTSNIIYSTRLENTAAFSPDGKQIAFHSFRSGNSEIWVCDADGANPVQLTSFGGPFCAWPRWSPDGESLAFQSFASGQDDVYVIPARGGKARRLTFDASGHKLASWSRNGQWIYYSGDRAGRSQIWKVPASGGQPVQVTQHGGDGAQESLDRKFLYYAKQQGGSLGLWRLKLADGEETRILESLRSPANFVVAEQGIYFTPPQEPGGGLLVQFLEFSSGGVRTIATIETQLTFGFAVSSDGRSILYDHLNTTGGDLMLVENFR